MNPFETHDKFNSHCYSIIVKINKASEKSVEQGLEELMNIDACALPVNNVVLRDSLVHHVTSRNLRIKKLSSNVLLRILQQDFDIEFWRSVIVNWFIFFVDNHSYHVDMEIYRNYINIADIEDAILEQLDWENNLLNSLKCTYFLCKTAKNDSKYHKYMITKGRYIKYNAKLYLKYLYKIMKIIGRIDDLYLSLVNITAPTLLDIKWMLLHDIYKQIPDCIYADSKYLSVDVLVKVMEEYTGSADDVEVRDFQSLCAILPRIKNKKLYLRKYVKSIKFGDNCVYRLLEDISVLDEIADANFVNTLIACTLRKHNMYNFFQTDKARIDVELQKNKAVKSIVNLDYTLEDSFGKLCVQSANDMKMKDNDATACNCTNNLDIFLNMLYSLEYLCDIDKIKRADILQVSLSSASFDMSSIMCTISHSLNVFEKEFFLQNKHELVDIVPLILRYPEEFDIEHVYEHIDYYNVLEFAKIAKFKTSVKRFLSANNIPQELITLLGSEFDLFLYNNNKITNVRLIDYDELCDEYLDSAFILKCYSLEIFDGDIFSKSIVTYLSSRNIPVTTEYSHCYYDTILHFYNDIKIKQQLPDIEQIHTVYKNKLYNDTNKLIHMVCCEILNLDYDLQAIRCTTMGLGVNNYFLYKVYMDIGANKVEPFTRMQLSECTNENTDIVNDGNCDILKVLDEYGIDKNNYKMIDIKMSKGVVDPYDADISFLSSRSLFIAIEKMIDSFSIYKIYETLEKDELLKNKQYIEKRLLCYTKLIDKIANYCSNCMVNNYGLSQVENNIDDDELYGFITSCFPQRKDLFWIILVNTMMKIRNLNLHFFIEKMVGLKAEFAWAINNLPTSMLKSLAFLFPNLYNRQSKTKVDITDLLVLESRFHVDNTKCKSVTSSTGIQMSIKYTIDNNEFACTIKYPKEYPLKGPVFKTNVEKNSLLNVKISEMCRKTSKFMEIINQWKINIDQKTQGSNECYICYFILHISDGNFPKYRCLHCNNMFHNKCIEKWLSGYNNSLCPLCRKPLPIY